MATRRLNPAAWTEGMFLRPQHFQHLDLSASERTLYHLRSALPFQWGLRAFELDEEALTDQRLEIRRLEAVLPGGTIVDFPGNAIVEPRKFEPAEVIPLYVGIRLQSESEAASAPDGSPEARAARWVIRSSELADVNREAVRGEIDTLVPNVRVFLGGEEPELELYDSFKLAELHATGDAVRPYLVADGYAPPLMAVQAWPPLADELIKLENNMAGKIRMVAGEKGSLTALDVRRILMWYTLARLSPVLRHLLSTGHTHPFDVYSLLVEIAASVSALNNDERLATPDYDHTSLYPCFRSVIEIINTELEVEFKDRSSELILPWSPQHSAYAIESVPMNLVNERNDYYLAVQADMGREELVAHVKSVGKIGSAELIARMVQIAVDGLAFQHLAAAPADVPTGKIKGAEFFRVDPRSSQNIWQRIKEASSFGVNLGNLDSASVRLFVVEPESAS